MIPKPHYTLINTSKGNDPAVVVVNSALRVFTNRMQFSWHLVITISCQHTTANGMPTAQEAEALYDLEDQLTGPLQEEENAMFLARITCRSERTLLFRVQDPERANTILQNFVQASSQLREWEYRMEHDSDWALAQPELMLLESALNVQ